MKQYRSTPKNIKDALKRSGEGHYPVSFEEYKKIHKSKNSGFFGHGAEDQRYYKACLIYDSIKLHGIHEGELYFSQDASPIIKPEDAFKYWWDC